MYVCHIFKGFDYDIGGRETSFLLRWILMVPRVVVATTVGWPQIHGKSELGRLQHDNMTGAWEEKLFQESRTQYGLSLRFCLFSALESILPVPKSSVPHRYKTLAERSHLKETAQVSLALVSSLELFKVTNRGQQITAKLRDLKMACR